jgi:type I restriction enzyme S subunit
MKLWQVAHINRAALPSSTPPDFAFTYVDLGAVADGTVSVPDSTVTYADAPERARRLAPPGSTVVSTVRTYLRAAAAVPTTASPLVFSTGFAVLEAKPLAHPAYLAYACQSDLFVDAVVARSTGVGYPAIGPTELADIDITLPALDEQERIAKLLDDATAALDQARELRARQRRLFAERFDALVDRVVAAAADAPRTRLDAVCDILPGRTFASSDFSADGPRLLRGINVGIGAVDWTEAVHWDGPVPDRYRLLAGDLVLAMDRPWIGGGVRLAFLTAADVPSVLVQRVARLRGSDGTDLRYLRWALHSRHFRDSVTLSGISVPHLRAGQIAAFAPHLPPLARQRALADELDRQSALTRDLAAAIDAQIEALAQRRRALISEMCTAG